MDICKCDLRTKLVGDGCQHCNPQITIDSLIEEIQTLRAKVEVLVEALRGAEAIVKSAILLEGEIEPYISESTYELNGCLGESAANISVRGRGVLNKITETLATYDKLSEVKHDTNK
ncbi:hypothetical protein [Methylotenera sp.]|uniref:hypothetical protein n=1 Tax=Methylotenera sp. TaxID=2051956 RepID=UPI002ED92CC5